MTITPIHVLNRLRLPARYERLEEVLGRDVVKLLTPPETGIEAFNRLGLASLQTGEGQLVPCYGETGVGKTTLAENLSFFSPGRFTPTLTHQGAIEYQDLQQAVHEFRKRHPPADGQLIPVSIDHREGAPPSDEELASLKRFLRTSDSPCIVLWLETNKPRAIELSRRFAEVTGKAIVELPLVIEGPAKETWHETALNTIELCNPLPSQQVSEIGIDPRTHDLSKYQTLGEFLRALSNEFANLVADHEASTRKPITLIIAYVSEATDRGVLPNFTHGAEPGLLDSHALLSCTPDSMIGRKWGEKRGILTQTIFRLDARAFWFPPAAVVAILRRTGPEEVRAILERFRALPSPADIHSYLGRTDFGRYLAAVKTAAYEMRGRPGEEAREALARVAAEYGFGSGHDKQLNRAILGGLEEYAKAIGLPVQEVKAEERLSFCSSLIPDTQIDLGDRVLCIEYVWRSGDALATNRRSEAAQYALEKLHNYAVTLGWTAA